MSSTLGIGVPVPKMLPITGTWTLPFAAYLLLLSNRVVYHRVTDKKYLGDTTTASASSTSSAPDPLLLETRAHANFLENVPLALTLAGVAELNGANRSVLNYALAALFVFRIAHVEVGMKGRDTVGLGRPVGYYGSQAFLAGMAGYCAYLVKGYWGF